MDDKAADLHEVGALLRKWEAAKQPLSVVFGGQGHTRTPRRLGTVTDVMLSKFIVSFSEGAPIELRYDNADATITDDGRSLKLAYPTPEHVIISEVG